MSKKVNKQNVGNAGEYYISAVLSARNFVVTVTLGRNIGYDLLVENPKGNALKISVKTRLESNAKEFILSNKAENIEDKNLFYAFVKLNEFKKLPDVWIVPAKEVAEINRISHEKWLTTPGKGGRKRRDTTMREFAIVQKKEFPENWEIKLKEYINNFELLENF